MARLQSTAPRTFLPVGLLVASPKAPAWMAPWPHLPAQREPLYPYLAFPWYELAGPDTGDLVIREWPGHQTFPVKAPATVPAKVKVKVVETVLLAVAGKVIGVGGNDVQKEGWLCIRRSAWLLDVG